MHPRDAFFAFYQAAAGYGLFSGPRCTSADEALLRSLAFHDSSRTESRRLRYAVDPWDAVTRSRALRALNFALTGNADLAKAKRDLGKAAEPKNKEAIEFNSAAFKKAAASRTNGAAAEILAVHALAMFRSWADWKSQGRHAGKCVVGAPQVLDQVPDQVTKVALVGQNLATFLSKALRDKIVTLFRRVLQAEPSAGASAVLALQPVAAVAEVDLRAALHMWTITRPALEALTKALGRFAGRVHAIFARRNNLSMLVWDWHRRPGGYYNPRPARAGNISRRRYFEMLPDDYTEITGDFGSWLQNVFNSIDADARWVPLPEAASAIVTMFERVRAEQPRLYDAIKASGGEDAHLLP